MVSPKKAAAAPVWSPPSLAEELALRDMLTKQLAEQRRAKDQEIAKLATNDNVALFEYRFIFFQWAFW